MHYISLHSLCSIPFQCTFSSKYRLWSWMWRHKLGTPVFGRFYTFFVTAPLKLRQIGAQPFSDLFRDVQLDSSLGYCWGNRVKMAGQPSEDFCWFQTSSTYGYWRPVPSLGSSKQHKLQGAETSEGWPVETGFTWAQFYLCDKGCEYLSTCDFLGFYIYIPLCKKKKIMLSL